MIEETKQEEQKKKIRKQNQKPQSEETKKENQFSVGEIAIASNQLELGELIATARFCLRDKCFSRYLGIVRTKKMMAHYIG